MTGSWLEWFRAVYPVIVTLFSLAGFACVLWLGSKFASKNAVDKIADTVAEHKTRLALIEGHIESAPTRQDLHDEISGLGERLSAVETGVKGMNKQLDTANDYLHTLIGTALGGRQK